MRHGRLIVDQPLQTGVLQTASGRRNEELELLLAAEVDAGLHGVVAARQKSVVVHLKHLIPDILLRPGMKPPGEQRDSGACQTDLGRATLAPREHGQALVVSRRVYGLARFVIIVIGYPVGPV